MTLLILLALAPFYLNDFLFIAWQGDFAAVIAVDYASRFISLLLVAGMLWRGKTSLKSLGFRRIDFVSFLKWSIILTAFGIAVDRSTIWYLRPVLMDSVLFEYPGYPSAAFRIFDLTIGIALVGLSEEVVFRGLLLSWLAEKNSSKHAAVAIQCFAFGLIHWSGGASSMIGGLVWAILPSFYMRRYRSIYPILVAHHFTDLVAFW